MTSTHVPRIEKSTNAPIIEEHRPTHSRLISVLGFTVGITAFVFVNVGGRLSIGEILCVPIAFVTIFSFGLRPTKYGLLLVAVTSLMVVGLTISSLSNGNSLAEAQAGIANYSVLALSAIGVASLLIYSKGRALTSLLLGAALGQIAGFYTSPTAEAVIDPWKFAIGWAVNVVVLIAAWQVFRRFRRRLPAAGIVLSLAALNVALGSRSAGVLVALSAIVFLLLGRTGTRRDRSFIALAAVIAVALFGATALYEAAAENGYFGAYAAQKLADQSGEYGLIFGARKELLFLIFAFVASPLIGWGAVARVPYDVRLPAYDSLAGGGYFFSTSDVDRLMLVDRLPLHSVALGAFVQAGIFALPLVLVLVALCVIAVRGTVRNDLGFATMLVVLGGFMHILISPLGDTTRIQVALALAVGMYVFSMDRKGGNRERTRTGIITPMPSRSSTR